MILARIFSVLVEKLIFRYTVHGIRGVDLLQIGNELLRTKKEPSLVLDYRRPPTLSVFHWYDGLHVTQTS